MRIRMKGKTLEKLFQKTFNKRHLFRGFADFIVSHHTTGLDDEQKEELSSSVALGLIMGNAIATKRNLLIGSTIGALGAVGALVIGVGIKERMEKEFMVYVTDKSDIEDVKSFTTVKAKDEESARAKVQKDIDKFIDKEFYEIHSVKELKE